MPRWAGGRVEVADSVSAAIEPDGQTLHDAFLATMPRLTLGLIRASGESLWFRRREVLRFGPPQIAARSVEWPILGGWAAGSPGGTWRIESSRGRLSALVAGYRPRLPRVLYVLTQLPIHHLVVRRFLRLSGRGDQSR